MNYYKVFLILFFIYHISYSQGYRKIKVRIFSKEDSTSVKYAEVLSAKKHFFLISDSLGNLSFYLDSILRYDTLIINHISYKQKIIPFIDFYDSKDSIFTIYLDKKTIKLQEIIIKPEEGKNKCTIIGPLKKRFKKFQSFPFSGREMALYFPNETKNKVVFVSNVNFLIYHSEKKYKFRIKIYNVNNLGLPDTLLLTEDIISTVSDKKSYTIDLLDNHVKIPENGIIISIEWLSDFENIYSLNNNLINNNYPIIAGVIVPIKNKKFKDFYTLIKKKGKWYKWEDTVDIPTTAYNWLFTAINIKVCEIK
jgi:hypothetical protein